MRKSLSILILAGALFAGCNSTSDQPSSTQEIASPPIDSQQVVETASEEVKPSTAVVTDQPLVIARPLPASGRHSGMEDAPMHFIYEKSAMNYKVSSPTNQGIAIALERESGLYQDEPSSPSQEFRAAIQHPLSTFSADVDTASFANVRREIQSGLLPSHQLVRVEEMLNYFNYDLPEPEQGQPFSVTTEISDCPWSPTISLMRVAIKTQSIKRGELPPRNLVFLLDVSGSMQSPDKLPLLQSSLRQLVDTLDDKDRVAIVVYAGDSGLVLPSTTGDQKSTILEAIESLQAGGSTNGADGLQLAYQVAEQHRSENSVNRIILATDGDFNVGISDHSDLKKYIEGKRDSGLFLSVLGFGRGANDKVMETLADHGNGNYASIDSLNEARKVLVQEGGATLVTVAKDVKFQVAFDPKKVEKYRLIGYQNRQLAARDFDDDTKDAGELGAGHSVTALYEIQFKKQDMDQRLLSVLDSENQPAVVKLRYKAPDADQSELMEVPVSGKRSEIDEASPDHQWAIAVAAYGKLLTEELSPDRMPFDRLYALLKPTMKAGPDAYQREFYELVKTTEGLLGE